MRRFGLFAAILTFIATPAAAETWRSIGWGGQRPARFFYFVDVDSVTRRGNIVSFWERESLEATERDGSNQVFNYRNGNCSTYSSQILRSRYQYGDRVIASYDRPGQWVTHGPGSMMEGGLKMICGQMDYDTGPLGDPDGYARRFFRNN